MFLLKIVIVALSVMFSAYIIPGISVSGFYIALLVSLVLALLNILLKPILVLLTLPVNIFSLGLFTFVINAFIFWLAGYIVSGFGIDGFIPAFFGSLIVSIFKLIADKIFDKK